MNPDEKDQTSAREENAGRWYRTFEFGGKDGKHGKVMNADL